MRNWSAQQIHDFAQTVAFHMVKMEDDVTELVELAASPEGWRNTVEESLIDQQIDRVFLCEDQPPLDVEATLHALQKFARFKIHNRHATPHRWGIS